MKNQRNQSQLIASDTGVKGRHQSRRSIHHSKRKTKPGPRYLTEPARQSVASRREEIFGWSRHGVPLARGGQSAIFREFRSPERSRKSRAQVTTSGRHARSRSTEPKETEEPRPRTASPSLISPRLPSREPYYQRDRTFNYFVIVLIGRPRLPVLRHLLLDPGP